MKTRMQYTPAVSESLGSNVRSERRTSEGANLLFMLLVIIVVYVIDFLKLAPLLYTGVALALVALFTMPQRKDDSAVKSFCCLLLFFAGIALSFFALVNDGTIKLDVLRALFQ